MATARPERLVIGVFGATGSGKTQTARALLRDPRLPPRIAILDPAADYVEGVDVEHVASSRDAVLAYLRGLEPGERFSVAYRPPPSDPEPEAAGFLARLVLATGDSVLLIDEAHVACRQGRCSSFVEFAVRRGRHRRVSILVVSQRPTDVSTDVRAEAYARETYLLRLARKRDLDDVALERGRQFADRLARLPDLEGVRMTPAGLTRFRVRIRPRPLPPSIELLQPTYTEEQRAKNEDRWGHE